MQANSAQQDSPARAYGAPATYPASSPACHCRLQGLEPTLAVPTPWKTALACHILAGQQGFRQPKFRPMKDHECSTAQHLKPDKPRVWVAECEPRICVQVHVLSCASEYLRVHLENL